MKMRIMKKKVVIFSITMALAITSTSFGALRIHGEAETNEAPKVENTVTQEKKALLTMAGDVTGRNNDGSTNDTVIPAEQYSTITDLMIGDQVTEIPENKFAGLKNITTLSFKAAATSKVATIKANAFKGLGISAVELPKDLTTIEEGAFADNKALTTVTFTHSTNLANIKAGAFENCNLTALDLSPMNGSTAATLTIGAKAFKGNTNLATLTLSSKMKAFESEVFASTKIKVVEIKQEVTKFDTRVFQGTPLATLTVATANTTFKAEANVLYDATKAKLLLYPEGLTGTEFSVPATVTHIEPYAFSSAPVLTKLTTGTALTHIGDYAFDGAKLLATVILNDALTSIGQYAFKATALASITLLGAMTEIGENAFANATSLNKLDLRKATALTTIKSNAFQGSGLSSMVIGKTTGALTTIETGAFSSTATTKLISFLEDSNTIISGDDLKTLLTKYKDLMKPANGSWTFDVKLPTPNASADYDKMQLTALQPSSDYTIDGIEYRTNTSGNLKILKSWSEKTIKIVRKATLGQQASDAQSLTIDKLYSIMVDKTEHSVKKAGATIHVKALEKQGYVFTQWQTTDVTLSNSALKTITFEMPSKDVNLTTIYTEIVVETPTKGFAFDGKNDVVVTIKSKFDNFSKLVVDSKDLIVDTDYTVSGTDTTIITLKKSYLATLTTTTQCIVTFTEGGEITFHVNLYGEAPVAQVNYKEMKLIELEKNMQYKIQGEVKTADDQGKIQIEKSWGGQTLEIIKVGTESETDSKPQTLTLQTFYTINVDGNDIGFTIKGSEVTLKAIAKDGYKFKEWTAIGVALPDASKENITFAMPGTDVQLKTTYTQIITTKPEDMVYNGKNKVIIRFDIPMVEFQDLEYNGQKLVKEVDYTVTSGSTIITFTKTFLDKMKEGMNGIKALFTNNAVTFTITHEVSAPPLPPLVDPTKPTLPQVQPVPATAVIKQTTGKSPRTGDNTNIYLLCTMLLLSIGAIIVVKRKQAGTKKVS